MAGGTLCEKLDIGRQGALAWLLCDLPDL